MRDPRRGGALRYNLLYEALTYYISSIVLLTRPMITGS